MECLFQNVPHQNSPTGYVANFEKLWNSESSMEFLEGIF